MAGKLSIHVSQHLEKVGCWQMGLLSEVSSLVDLVIRAANAVQLLENNWDRASSQDWKAFPDKVRVLQEKHNLWEARFKELGLSTTDPVTKFNSHGVEALLQNLTISLKLVREIVENEVDKFRLESSSCGGRCWPKFKKTIFPPVLGATIDGLISTFDNFVPQLKEDAEVRPLLDNIALQRWETSHILADSKYVHFKTTERSIHDAFNRNPTCPTSHDHDYGAATVILLHGAPGKGKTMLARHMHWYYENEKLDSFSNVFYLECGPTASGPAKQLELLQRLDSEQDVAGAVQELDLLQKLRGGGEQDVERPQNAGLEISKRLGLKLKSRTGQMLIIMDDVFKGELVQNIAQLCREGVTFLVTSRFHDMCKGMTNLSCIKMEDVGNEDAMKILAGHLNFKGHHIPSHLQSIARKMIGKTDSNPLALASLAAAIGDSTEASDWLSMCQDLFDSWHVQPDRLIVEGKYPGSFWSTMRLSIYFLNQAQHLQLMITSQCEAPSVPEEVVRLIYGSRKQLVHQGLFTEFRDCLSNGDLLHVSAQTYDWAMEKRRTWSMHALQKYFVSTEMKQHIETLWTSLFDEVDESNVNPEVCNEGLNDTEEVMVAALCALYLDKATAERAAKKLNISVNNFNDLKRNAMEPLIWLLAQPLSDSWPEAAHLSTRKVFMKYLRHGVLDDQGICELLTRFQVSTLATLKVMQNVSDIGDPFLDESELGLMETLVSLLAEGWGKRIQSMALDTLSNFGFSCQHSHFLISFPGVLGEVVRLLGKNSRSESSHVKAHPTTPLSDPITSQLLESSTELLEHDSSTPLLRSKAARCLSGLAYGADKKGIEKMINFVGLLEPLVQALNSGKCSGSTVDASEVGALGTPRPLSATGH